jgi:hypothetical protein
LLLVPGGLAGEARSKLCRDRQNSKQLSASDNQSFLALILQNRIVQLSVLQSERENESTVKAGILLKIIDGKPSSRGMNE